MKLRRGRFWTAVGLAALNATLVAVTAIWPEWIELVFHADPDRGSGAVEWLVVAFCAITTIVATTFGATEWRRGRTLGE
jgi:hypothetical protein